MRSPQKTDLNLDTLQYSLFATLWTPLNRPLLEEYGITFTDLRIMACIDSLIGLYGIRLNGRGITVSQIVKMTTYNRNSLKRRLIHLLEHNYIFESDREQGVKKIVIRYKLTKTGKTVINKVSGNMDKVHERIIAYLYSKKLLK